MPASRSGRDVLAIYAIGSFFDDIWVEEEPGEPRGGKIIIFNVKDKPKIRRVDYMSDCHQWPQSDVLKALSEKKASLSQASNYDEPRVRRAILIIKSLLAEKGRQKAEDRCGDRKHTRAQTKSSSRWTVNRGPKDKDRSRSSFVGNAVFLR